MNSVEIKSTARANTVALLQPVLDANAAVQFGDASWAILQNVDGQEVWVEISVKTKAYKATKVTPEFDPFVAADAWKEEKKIKADEKAAKAAEKARKIAAKEKKG